MEPPANNSSAPREIDTKIHRLAYEILERHPKEKFILVGIHRRGVPLAQRACQGAGR